MSTRTAYLVSKALGEPLVEYLQRHRDDKRSWKWIAEDLDRLTGCCYSRELLRRTLPVEDPQQAEIPADAA